jgi:DNA-binding NarL/FixJ family response regulator
MNDLVQQLLNPIIHKPDGGRTVIAPEMEKHQAKKTYPNRRKPVRSETRSERFERMYQMHKGGMSFRKIADCLHVSHATPRYGIGQHEKTMRKNND